MFPGAIGDFRLARGALVRSSLLTSPWSPMRSRVPTTVGCQKESPAHGVAGACVRAYSGVTAARLLLSAESSSVVTALAAGREFWLLRETGSIRAPVGLGRRLLLLPVRCQACVANGAIQQTQDIRLGALPTDRPVARRVPDRGAPGKRRSRAALSAG
jgi:hypothetical protein